MTLGLKIQDLRKKAQLTQDELAEILGVSRQALSKWENDTSIPDIDKVILLSKTFSVTTDYLLKDELPLQVHLDIDMKKQLLFQLRPIILVIFCTIIVLIGLIISVAMQSFNYYGAWDLREATLGIIIQLMGVGLFTVFHINQKYDKTYRLWFWLINIWFISYIHHNLLYFYFEGAFFFLFHNAPYNMAYYVSDSIYLLLNCTVTLVLFRLIQRNKITLKT